MPKNSTPVQSAESQSTTASATPPTFRDSENQQWTLKLSLGLLDEVLAATQVDLACDNGDPTPVVGLLFDRRKLGAVLWAVCARGAKARAVTREKFFAALDSDALTSGWGALVDSVVFFTPSRNRPALLAAIDQQMKTVEGGVLAMARVIRSETTDEAIQERMTELEQQMQQGLASALASAVTN